MRMQAESLSGIYPVLVDHSQTAEADPVGIVVVGKGKRMPAVEPIQVRRTAFVTSNDINHDLSPGIFSAKLPDPSIAWAIAATVR